MKAAKRILPNLIDQTRRDYKVFQNRCLFKGMCSDRSCYIINVYIATRHIKISKRRFPNSGDGSLILTANKIHIHIRHVGIGIVYRYFIKCTFSDAHSIIYFNIYHRKALIDKYIILDTNKLLYVVSLCHIDSSGNTKNVRFLVCFFPILYQTHLIIVQQFKG